MIRHARNVILGLGALLVAGPTFAGSGDPDGGGFLERDDYTDIVLCFQGSGPDVPHAGGACVNVDVDDDGDIDLQDLASILQAGVGHLPIVLKDQAGNELTVAQSVPYSPRQTCGGCHDLDSHTGITNGLHFQQGRTDATGNVVTQDDFFGDGRTWVRGPGRYGSHTTATAGGTQLAPKTAASESEIDRTTFAWVADCGGCHAGGGPAEFDRDDRRLYDVGTGQFG